MAGLNHRPALRLQHRIDIERIQLACIHIEYIRNTVAGVGHDDFIRQDAVFDDKTRDVVVGDGLFLLDLHQLCDVHHGGIGHLLTVLVFVGEKACHLDPTGGAVGDPQRYKKLIAPFTRFGHFLNLFIDFVPAALVFRKILVAVVVEQRLIFRLGVSDQIIIEVVGPDQREMLVHQMQADADFHGPHQHFLFIFHLDQLGHIHHDRIGAAVTVDIFVRKVAEELDPEAGTVLMLHTGNNIILIFAVFQHIRNRGRKLFPSFGIVLIILVGMIVEQGFIFFLRIANQLIVILVGPDTSIVFIHHVLTDADLQDAHEHFLFVDHLLQCLLCVFLLQLRFHHFGDVGQSGVGHLVSVDVLVRKRCLQLYPKGTAVRSDQPHADGIPLFSIGTRVPD